MPLESVAVPATVTEPVCGNTAPFCGVVIVTTGGVVSGSTLLTVTLTATDTHILLAAS